MTFRVLDVVFYMVVSLIQREVKCSLLYCPKVVSGVGKGTKQGDRQLAVLHSQLFGTISTNDTRSLGWKTSLAGKASV